jgi:type IV pilus assembly protein PilB
MPTNVAEVRLGDLFVREGLIDAGQLQEALKDAKERGIRVGFSLVKLGFVAENELTRMLSKQYRLPAVDLEKVTVEEKIHKLIYGEMAYKHLVLPLRKVGRTFTVAMANPSDLEAVDVLRFKTRFDIESCDRRRVHAP